MIYKLYVVYSQSEGISGNIRKYSLVPFIVAINAE